jgi:predicted nucleotidyltransferase
MYKIHHQRVEEAIANSSYKTIQALAKALGMHRNTIHYHLSQAQLISPALSKILKALQLTLPEVLTEEKGGYIPHEEIAPLVDTLHAKFPDVTVILFGSRAIGRARRYSDYDLGVFSAKGLTHSQFRSILALKEELEENSTFQIDLVNLNAADEDFLKSIAKQWRLLAGRFQDWVQLQKRVVKNVASS